MRDKVSIITPTYNRESFLRLAHRCVASQTYPELEWLVLDDSAAPSEYMLALNDPRIRYRHVSQRMKIGRKRNELVAEAGGSVIVHFDDDDYYAPAYVERMLSRLARGCDFVKLSGCFLYSVAYRALGYWDLNRKLGRHYVWSPPHAVVKRRLTRSNNQGLEDNHLGYGFSYVYRRAVWTRQPFPDDRHWGEDTPFALAAMQAFRFEHFRDLRGICLHVLHGGNTSRCFPQYVLPSFALPWLFGADARDFVAT